MKITGELKALEFDLARYKVEVDNFLTASLHQGIRIWLTAVTGRVPLWSGMARAALLQISQLVNGKVVLSPLQGKSRIPQGASLGHGKVTTSFPNYSFEVQVEVEHYVIQEDTNVRNKTGRGSPSAPWRSFDAGEQAFREYVRTLRLPPVQIESKAVRIS